MHAIRTSQTVTVGGRDHFAEQYGFHTGPGTDWFGNVNDQRPSVHCPLCGLPAEDARSYRAHLLLDHAFAERVRKRNVYEPPKWLSWVPAPMFWSLLLLVLYGGGLFAVFGDSTVSVAGLWAGIIAFLAFLPVAYRVERHRRRL
jgi:hypothetical protein